MGIAEPRVLFVTTYVESGDTYDYWGTNISGRARFSYPRFSSYGLRFLKKNIPQIEILEYPTIDEYKEKLKQDYDIVGFSFFTHEIPKIKEMVKLARKAGVEEIWGGHYGVLTYDIEKIFDKTFVGYAERKVAEALNVRLNRVKHPYLVDLVGLPGKLRAFPIGVLFTSRGCHLECEFCQTPVFCPESYPVPFESLKKTILEYKKDGISEILIPEEHFGLEKKHTEKVIDLLDENDMNWYAQTSINILHKKLDDWYERGLSGAMLGIEGLRQEQVNSVNKNIDVDKTISLLNRLKEKNTFIIGNYMIGFEDDTEENIKRCISRLTKFPIDIIQICILTPFPKTPLWDDIQEKYGIIEDDWGKWDTKHLVWKHPNISQEKMKRLLKWCFNKAYPRYRLFQTPMKFYRLHSNRYKNNDVKLHRFKTMKKIFSDFWKANVRFEEPPLKI